MAKTDFTNLTRFEMLRRVADGQRTLGPMLWHFNNLTRCDEILGWLIKNGVTGKELYSFSRFYAGNSILRTAQEILKRVDRNDHYTPILVGRDYKV